MPAIDLDTAKPRKPKGERPSKPRNAKLINFLLEVAILLGALGIGLAIRFGMYETMIVTSGSMETTMGIGERFLVDHRETLSHRWRRGDIITFNEPELWGGEGDMLVKRVIALPGERLLIDRGKVFINNRPLKEDYLKEAPLQEDIGPIIMGVDQYFVMGDNRNHSDDSRENGAIEDKHIRGRVALRLWPPQRFGKLGLPDYGS